MSIAEIQRNGVLSVRARERILDARPLVHGWLVAVIVCLFALIIVGGATRLTDSGLSITEWQPIIGMIPPLSLLDWHMAFEAYKQIPEYSQVNAGMTLSEFKVIFWWEWGHRFLARFIGLLVFVPLVFFWMSRRLAPHLKLWLVGLFLLGGLQGVIGWWMVASGLTERVDVSQYRLAMHLMMACLILGLTMWVRGLVYRPGDAGGVVSSRSKFWAWLLLVALVVQIFMGALVAGLRAGLTYNEWPTMDGEFLPGGLLDLQPFWLNAFESILTVQFNHRVGAYLLIAIALVSIIVTLKDAGVVRAAKIRSLLLFAAVFGQAVIGIFTLLWVVPISLGLLHQGGAMLILLLSVYHLQQLRNGH